MVTKEEVLKIAKLASLEIDESELEEATAGMSEIIEFANKINEAAEFNFGAEADVPDDALVNAVRADEVVESFTNEEILKNCKTARDGFFYIAKSGRKL